MEKSKPRIAKFLTKIRGWLTQSEAWLLFRLAKQVPKSHCIVELGSFEGRSTACLAEGARFGNNLSVYAVDPHTGSPEHWRAWRKIDTFDSFCQNMKKFGFQDAVIPVRLTSAEAARNPYPPVGLLFIDAEHGLKSTIEDNKLWFPKVDDGGVIAFHDAVHSDYVGPGFVTAKLLLLSQHIKNPWQVGSITYFTKNVSPVGLHVRIGNWLFLCVRTLICSPLYLFGLLKFPLKMLGMKNNIKFN